VGVDGKDVVITSVQLSGSAYAQWQTVANTHQALLQELRRQPGIRAAGATNFLPFETGWRNPVNLSTQPVADAQELPQMQQHVVTDGYFEAMGARLVTGRFFDAHDTSASEGVAIVNESFVKRFSPTEPIVGRQVMSYSQQVGPLGRNLLVTAGPDQHPVFPPLRVIGVVDDVRNTALGQPIEPTVYFPDAQFTFRSVQVAISAVSTEAAVSGMKNALHAIAPDTPLGTVETWTHKLSARTAEPQLLMTTLSTFAVLAAVLAGIGVYGLFSWTVALRKRELAIRLTLGARPSAVGGRVLAQSLTLVLVGAGVGWAIVRLSQGLLARVLFDITATDSASAAAAGGVLVAASLVAAIPATLRAMRVDPAQTLRGD